MTSKGISVVVPVYNNADLLVAQLDALGHAMADASDVELIVVNNRSTDGSDDTARRWARDSGCEVTLIDADAKPGEPYARNVGFRAASHDLVAFCDGDDVVWPTWIDGMRSALDRHGYATGPVATDALNPPWLANVRGAVFDGVARLEGVVPYAHGCNMGFRREVLEELGGFDESFMIGCDIEIAIRAWKAGFELGWEPSAGIDYRLRESPGDLYRQGRAYAQSRRRTHALLGDSVPSTPRARSNARRLAWLVRKMPRAAFDLATRARWIWVASQLDGELRSMFLRTSR